MRRGTQRSFGVVLRGKETAGGLGGGKNRARSSQEPKRAARNESKRQRRCRKGRDMNDHYHRKECQRGKRRGKIQST